MDYKQKYEEALEIAKYYKERDNIQFLEDIFPELKESEDERIRKEIIAYLDVQEVLAQGKYGDFKEWIAWLEKQDEQKSTDKVEPRFKVGDWITNSEYTWKITDIKPLDYILQSQNGDMVSDDNISYVDENFRLWTIQDAKDGDVISSENPFIFRDFGDGRHPNSPTAYCGINSSGTFILSAENDWWTANDVYPATKEQRDLLFQKMKDAGYEWDAEKRELKKIEQNPAWSEEDEKMLKSIIYCIDGTPLLDSDQIDWLKSLKPRWKPSEVQIKVLEDVLETETFPCISVDFERFSGSGGVFCVKILFQT